jgi:hypothetical protein
MAVGFLVILFLGRVLFGNPSPWPVFPAVALLAIGIVIGMAAYPAFFVIGLIWLPLVVILAGVYLGWLRH